MLNLVSVLVLMKILFYQNYFQEFLRLRGHQEKQEMLWPSVRKRMNVSIFIFKSSRLKLVVLADRNHGRHPGRGGCPVQLSAGHGHQHLPLLRPHPPGIPGQHQHHQHSHYTGETKVNYLNKPHKTLQEPISSDKIT